MALEMLSRWLSKRCCCLFGEVCATAYAGITSKAPQKEKKIEVDKENLLKAADEERGAQKTSRPRPLGWEKRARVKKKD